MGNKKRAVRAEGALLASESEGVSPTFAKILRFCRSGLDDDPLCDVTNKNNMRYSAGFWEQ